MTTELKQAAQQAVDAFDAFGDADDFASLFELTQKMRALRAAIQQAEAQQPDTGDDFDLICNAIDKADTITMEGDYMLDSDDCIAVVRVMQVLLSVRAAMLAAK